MYDVVMLNFARLDATPDELATLKEEIEHVTADLSLTNERFIDSISLATGDRTRLFSRVQIYAEALAGFGLTSGLEDLATAVE